MALMDLWFTKADRHYDVECLDAEVVRNAESNLAVGKRANIMPADPEPFKSTLKGEILGISCAEFFADPTNPFDEPIEDLLKECNA